MRSLVLIIISLLFALSFAGCVKQGCTDPSATNYDESAKKDDGSCIYRKDNPTQDVRTEIIGEYICKRTSEHEGIEDKTVVVEIFPVRTCDRLLRFYDSDLGLTFYMVPRYYDDGIYYENGILRDTAMHTGIPFDMRSTSYGSFSNNIHGTFGSDSIWIDYVWTDEQYAYNGTRIEKYAIEFGPDYREKWVGSYKGKVYDSHTGSGAFNSESDAVLDVFITADDRVIRIERGDSTLWTNAYVSEAGVLDFVNKNEIYGTMGGADARFVGDSLNIHYWNRSASGEWDTEYKCKKVAD